MKCYSIEQGDTIRSICAKFGVALGDTMKANGVRNLTQAIKPGMRLLIPTDKPLDSFK